MNLWNIIAKSHNQFLHVHTLIKSTYLMQACRKVYFSWKISCSTRALLNGAEMTLQSASKLSLFKNLCLVQLQIKNHQFNSVASCKASVDYFSWKCFCKVWVFNQPGLHDSESEWVQHQSKGNCLWCHSFSWTAAANRASCGSELTRPRPCPWA